MTVAASIAPGAARADTRATAIRIAWIVIIAATAVLWIAGQEIAPWAVVYPKGLEVPAAKWISAGMNWLVDDATFGLFTFTELTRAIAAVVEVPYTVALSVLSTGFLKGEGSNAVQLLPPLSWMAVIAIVSLIGYHAGGRRLAILVGLCFLYLAVFGQWQSAMQTLASILVAVPIGVAGGLLLGLAGYRWPRLRAGDAAGPRPDADGADLRLSRADPLSVRLRAGRLDRRHHHLRHAADGAGDDPRACRACRTRSATSAG